MIQGTIQYRDTRIVLELFETDVATVSLVLILQYTGFYFLPPTAVDDSSVLVRFKSVREQFDVGTAADAAEYPSLSSLDVPLLSFELILVHPLNAVEAEHEHKEKNRLHENAVGDVGVSKHDVYFDDTDEGGALRVLHALMNFILVQNKGAPYAESEYTDDIQGHCHQFKNERVPISHEPSKEQLYQEDKGILQGHEAEILLKDHSHIE